MRRGSLFILALASCVGFVPALAAEESTTGWTASPDVIAELAERIPAANFDEAKVPPYTLPDPLTDDDGARVTKRTWPARRAEIVELFREHVYGRVPVDRPPNLSFDVVAEGANDLEGKATRKLVEISFDTPHAGRFSFQAQLFLPNDAAGPVPTFVLLQFQGLIDPATEQIIDRGYGVAIVDRTGLAADDATTYRDGVIGACSGPDQLPDDAWRAIAAWAWGASRVMDYLETDPAVDKRRIAVIGFSRMGKTALWAGAADERFAAVISNESGCGGAALSRRAYGETVGRITTGFPHWFCENFNRYADREDELPVDQHMLVALVAPRLIYVASADEDLWADPRGEFLACAHANPVYRLLGVPGLATDEMPPLEQPLDAGRIGYHIRRGRHGLLEYDWRQFMDFLDRHLAHDAAAPQ